MVQNRIKVKVYADNKCYNKLVIGATAAKPSRAYSRLILALNGVTVHYLLTNIHRCSQCLELFVKYLLGRGANHVRINLLPQHQCPDTIDHNWNNRVSEMVRERCELDHALSWLSTLGGAFSALGDYFSTCAETAAKISAHQFQLALRMGDPDIAARCRLYYALSLIQRKHFRIAREIIHREYHTALKATTTDHRLLKMCKGIWSKLQYEWQMHHQLYNTQSSLNRTRKKLRNVKFS